LSVFTWYVRPTFLNSNLTTVTRSPSISPIFITIGPDNFLLVYVLFGFTGGFSAKTSVLASGLPQKVAATESAACIGIPSM